MTSGFRYDTTYQRWVRDERATNSMTTITTMTGEQYTAWPVCFSVLEQKGLKSYAVEDVQKELAQGKCTLIDIRPSEEYERGHVEGSVNVPLFIKAVSQTKGMRLKRIAFAFLAMTPRERNPTFLADCEAALGGKKPRKPFYVMCSQGGSMDRIVTSNKLDGQGKPYTKRFEDPERDFGRESRSLKAAFELYNAGFTNLKHVRGGYQRWIKEELPIVAYKK